MSSERRNSAHIKALENEILMTPVADRKQLKNLLDNLVEETIEEEGARPHHGNPAVIGLAAFAITATLFQFHNFGWVSKNPVMCLGVVLGGVIQLFAGLLEFANGNNFGMAVFSGYGSFWISLVAIMVLNDYTRYTVNSQDMAFFNLCFLIFTIILFVASLRETLLLAFIFFTLVAGIFFFMVDNFIPTTGIFKIIAAVFLLVNSMAAFYLLASILLASAYRRPVLPVGLPVHKYIEKIRGKENINV